MTNPTPIAGTVLPRASSLTDALLAPAGRGFTGPGRSAAERALLGGVSRLPRDLGGGRPVRVDRFLLRQARLHPELLGRPDPFRWSSTTATRALGLAAVRASLHDRGSRHSPMSSVDGVIRRLTVRGGDVPSSLGRWLREIHPAARAAVRADAVTWATNLATALDWDRLGPRPDVGGPDRWWDCPSAPQLALRSRVEVRVDLPAGPSAVGARRSEGRAGALFVVGNGYPSAGSGEELALVALAEVLARPGSRPARIVGWWPHSGRALVLTVDDGILERAVQAVLHAVEALAAAWPMENVA